MRRPDDFAEDEAHLSAGRLSDILPADPERGPFVRLAQGQRKQILLGCIRRLRSPLQVQVLLLHYGNGWKLARIAEALRLSRSAVTQAHQRVLVELRGELEARGIFGIGDL